MPNVIMLSVVAHRFHPGKLYFVQGPRCDYDAIGKSLENEIVISGVRER